jgi:hypothetical protein
MPCDPSDITLNIPDGPSGPAIPGFGKPFSLNIPNISLPDGFPEDLLSILDFLQLLVPSGAFKPQLSLNFGKDIFDGIMKLLDQFMPFLMLYKFFLPLLNIIICIIEVLCALSNPFKVIRALKRLFRKCIPDFLNMFPIFALIIMIISLLLLLLALIEYIISQILKFIQLLLKNILGLVKAFNYADANAIISIAKKIGALLCIFQNLFVLLSIFNIVIQVIRDILGMLFSIPACDDTDPSDLDGCCTPDVCPAIVKTEYTRDTGEMQYLPKYGFDSGTSYPGFGKLTFDLRVESWQFYDNSQAQAEQFINIINAFDVAITPKPVFFPTDSVYVNTTAIKQAAYLIDLRFWYEPSAFPGRVDTSTPRYIKFLNCIMKLAPTDDLLLFNNTPTTIANGVVYLVGGSGYEDDGVTPLFGFDDGINKNSYAGAGLEGFIHVAPTYSTSATLVDNHIIIANITYTFKPSLAVLLSKDLVTAGCEPSLALTKGYINQAYASDIGTKISQLSGLFSGKNKTTRRGGGYSKLGSVEGAELEVAETITDLGFPDADAAQACLSTALSALRADLTVAGVAQFQTSTTICLQKLKDEVHATLSPLIGIGFEACKSNYTVSSEIEFTSKPIIVSVTLNERNGLSLTSNLPTEVAVDIAHKISAHVTFGSVSNFTYNGVAFTANITSASAGSGEIMISFDNNIFCTNIIPEDVDTDPSRTLQSLPYQFVYSQSALGSPDGAEGDTEGKPRRDTRDIGNS